MRNTLKQIDRRKTDRQTDRQTDRETGRQTDIYKLKLTHWLKYRGYVHQDGEEEEKEEEKKEDDVVAVVEDQK